MPAFFLALALPILLMIVNLHQLDHLPHRSLARLAARHRAPLMSLRLGAVLTVVASSPDVAREVLQRHNAYIAARSIGDSMRAGSHCNNSVLCLPPRHRWRALRRLGATELFSPPRLRAMEPLRREAVSTLLRHVSDHAARGAAVDVGAAAHAAALGLLARTMFSGDLDPRTAREVSDVVDEASVLAAGPNVSDFFPALAAADIQGVRRRMARLVKRMYAIIDDQIEQREGSRAAGEARKNDLLDVMLDKEGEVEEEGTDDVSHNTIRGLFTSRGPVSGPAPRSASSTTPSPLPTKRSGSPRATAPTVGVGGHLSGSGFGALSRKRRGEAAEQEHHGEGPLLGHPRRWLAAVWMAAAAAVAAAAEQEQAVVKETLRLHPPVPLPPYEAEATVEIQGYTIPKGTKVLINIWAINRCPDAWIEPNRFMPERFLEAEINFMGRDFHFIPFGAGRRIYLGLPLAYRMVHLMLGSLLHRFRWTLPAEVEKNGVDMRERFGLALSLVVPLHAIPQEIH
ncbi:hypothetical protein SETIT_8G161000v2 [Setaria italica]|uniref:Cytochrome P450 n=1 Tax=Setaria italica TaxID=4555 RepID=A0A368S8C5_SETIT|nr:hypothetical protein SETIT_8G161000v2 [Setaria italica]